MGVWGKLLALGEGNLELFGGKLLLFVVGKLLSFNGGKLLQFMRFVNGNLLLAMDWTFVCKY